MAASAIPDTFLAVTPQEEGTFIYRVRARDAENQIGPWSLSRSITIENGTGIGDTPVLATRLGPELPEPVQPDDADPVHGRGSSEGAGSAGGCDARDL